jgi:glucose-1-phosphatase
MKYEALILDLGGVLIEVNYQKTTDAFAQLGIANFNTLFNQHKASTLFEALETGEISEINFLDALRTATSVSLSNQAIINAWNAMLGNFWPNRIAWVQKIAQKIPVYLYSNTNAIHYQAFTELFSANFKSNLNDLFTEAWYSHLVQLRKPYAASYKILIEKANLTASATLFIDDTLVNIHGANEAGLQTLHLKPGMELSSIAL